MTYNAEQITFMLAEAIDQDREYKSWHVSTKHLMTLVEMVVAEERDMRNFNIQQGEEHMKEKRLLNGAVVPVDVETTAALVAEIKRLIDVVGGMALAQRTWVGLTDKEIEAIWEVAMFANYGVGAELSNQPFVHYARAIEAKLKEKNL